MFLTESGEQMFCWGWGRGQPWQRDGAGFGECAVTCGDSEGTDARVVLGPGEWTGGTSQALNLPPSP